jgi:hypothetical protein
MTLLAAGFLPTTAKTFDWKTLLVKPRPQSPANEPEKPDTPSFIWCSRTVGHDDRLFAKCMKDERASAERIASLTVHPGILDYCQRLRDGIPSQVDDCLKTHNSLDDLTQILKDNRE